MNESVTVSPETVHSNIEASSPFRLHEYDPTVSASETVTESTAMVPSATDGVVSAEV